MPIKGPGRLRDVPLFVVQRRCAARMDDLFGRILIGRIAHASSTSHVHNNWSTGSKEVANAIKQPRT